MRPLGRGERLEPPRGGRAVCSTPTWQLLGAACLLQTEALREVTGRCVSPKNKTDGNSSSCQGREQLNSASVDSSAGSSKPPTQTRAKLGVRWGLNQAFLPWPDCHQAACTLSVSPTLSSLPVSFIFASQTPLPSPSKAERSPPSTIPRAQALPFQQCMASLGPATARDGEGISLCLSLAGLWGPPT